MDQDDFTGFVGAQRNKDSKSPVPGGERKVPRQKSPTPPKLSKEDSVDGGASNKGINGYYCSKAGTSL